MGWLGIFDSELTFKYNKYGRKTVDRKAYLDKCYTWKRESGCFCKVLKSSLVNGVYYAAVQNPDGVHGIVTLTQGRRSKNDQCGLYYKDMDESMGPYYYDCPVSILNLLTPTQDERALAWRKICRDRAAKKKEERKTPQPLPTVGGVEITKSAEAWYFSTEAFRRSTGYQRVRYGRRSWSIEGALKHFIEKYGTAEQKAEYASTYGKEEEKSA